MAPGVLAHILGHVSFYCQENDLPRLNAIVVNASGVPGDGIPGGRSDSDTQREAVYGVDWYDVYPPTENELAEAHQRNADGS